MANIAICIPSNDHWRAETATATLAAALEAERNGHRVQLINQRRATISMNRNDIVKTVLDLGYVDKMLWLDSDIVVKPNVIDKFLAHEELIVGASYCKRYPPHEPLEVLSKERIKAKDLQKAYFLPGGCMFVDTRVYRALQWPWYFDSLKWEAVDGVKALVKKTIDESQFMLPPSLAEKFEAAIRTDSDLVGWLNGSHEFSGPSSSEDINFCLKARRKGFDIWCDLSVTEDIGHMTSLAVTRAPRKAPSES
jgi:hypothetical protein